MPIKDVDRGYRALVDRIFTLGNPTVSVGVFEADGAQTYDDGITIAAVAAIHEFGLGVPERSFLRGWFDENLERAHEAMSRLLLSVVAGKRTKEQALELFGLWVQGEVQKRIASGISPELSAATIKRKGSSTPLIDTGQLRSSITYQIDFGNGTTKTGTSDAAIERHQKAKAAKVAAKSARRKEVRAARKKLSKDFKKLKKNVSKKIKRATKRVIRKIR